MSTDEIIQLMRTCSLAKVRAQLELAKKKCPTVFNLIEEFYKSAAARK